MFNKILSSIIIISSFILLYNGIFSFPLAFSFVITGVIWIFDDSIEEDQESTNIFKSAVISKITFLKMKILGYQCIGVAHRADSRQHFVLYQKNLKGNIYCYEKTDLFFKNKFLKIFYDVEELQRFFENGRILVPPECSKNI